MAGVSINKKREKPLAEVDILTPHGAVITVSAQRAKTLMARPPLRMGDGVARKYVLDGEDNVVDMGTTAARAPRKGSNENTGAGD